jgi:hypothetical protein
LLSDADVNWDGLTVDLSGLPPASLIGGFFNAFLQEVYTESPELLSKAKAINWETDYDFQLENIMEWTNNWNPHVSDIGNKE